MHPNNSILRESYPYAKRSHLTLLIFRKEGEDTHTATLIPGNRDRPGSQWTVMRQGSPRSHFLPAGEGKAIELKHQRNPDAFFDCVRSAEGEIRPEEGKGDALY